MATVAVDARPAASARVRRFAFTLLAALLAFAAIGPFEAYRILGDALFGGADADLHRMHFLYYGLQLGLFLVPALALSVHRPEQRPAAMTVAAVVIAALTLDSALIGTTDPASWIALGLAWVTVFLHPARSEVFGQGRRFSLMIGAAAAAVALPWLGHTIAELRVHLASLGTLDPHAVAGHYIGSTIFSFVVPVLAAVSAFRLRGFHVPGWMAAAASVLYGGASLLFARTASALSMPVAVLAIAAGVALAVAIEVERRRTRATVGR